MVRNVFTAMVLGGGVALAFPFASPQQQEQLPSLGSPVPSDFMNRPMLTRAPVVAGTMAPPEKSANWWRSMRSGDADELGNELPELPVMGTTAGGPMVMVARMSGGPGGLMGGVMGEECRAAIVATCTACPTPPPAPTPGVMQTYTMPEDECTAHCTEPRSSTCAECRKQLQEECKSCQTVNAAALITAGCTHIACEQATAQLCPVCTPEQPAEASFGEQCRYCGPDNSTDTCTACKAVHEERQQAQQQCRECQEANMEALANGGCTQFVCRLATTRLCPECVQDMEECRFCRPDNTTDVCATCTANREACSTCMQANNASMPEECRMPAASERPAGPGGMGVHRVAFFNNPSGAPMTDLETAGLSLEAGDAALGYFLFNAVPDVTDSNDSQDPIVEAETLEAYDEDDFVVQVM